jgi:uncharacterized protein YceH (UPF0502 family)
MKKITHLFKTPDARQVAAKQLAEARIDLLDAHADVESSKAAMAWHEARVDAYEERVARLESYLESAE